LPDRRTWCDSSIGSTGFSSGAYAGSSSKVNQSGWCFRSTPPHSDAHSTDPRQQRYGDGNERATAEAVQPTGPCRCSAARGENKVTGDDEWRDANEAHGGETIMSIPGALRRRVSRGAHVRRRTGCSMKPLSSKNTIGLPLRRAPFFMRGQARVRQRSSSSSSPSRARCSGFLARPIQVVQDLAEVIRVIPHAKRLGHDFGHTLASPQIGVVAGCQRSGQKNIQ